MPTTGSQPHKRPLRELLTRDHTLNEGILFGLDGGVIEGHAFVCSNAKEKSAKKRRLAGRRRGRSRERSLARAKAHLL